FARLNTNGSNEKKREPHLEVVINQRVDEAAVRASRLGKFSYAVQKPKSRIILLPASRRRSDDNSPRRCLRWVGSTAQKGANRQSVGHSSPSASSRIISCRRGKRLALRDEAAMTLM